MLLARSAHAAAAGGVALGAVTMLPFWPPLLAAALVALAAGVAFLRPRLGLGAALALGVFPLGNLSLGLALAYAAAAPLWLALVTATPRAIRRAGVVATVIVAAGLGPLGVAREESPLAALEAVTSAVPPETWRVALALAAAAACVTLARTPWRAALWGAGLMATLLLPNPELAALPVIAATWAASAALALRAAS